MVGGKRWSCERESARPNIFFTVDAPAATASYRSGRLSDLNPSSMRWRAAAVSLLVVVAVSCGGDQSATPPGGSTPAGSASGTFDQLQRTVLTPTCAQSDCHASALPTSGNLALTPAVAYDNLVNARPSSLAADRDGLKRVVPFKPDSSLLFQKVVLSLAAHNGEYGNIMPVGSPALTQGQVDFIKKWIEAGAPRAGVVADTALLASKALQSGATFVPLAAPPVGQGYQIHVDSFGVKANFERELFVYRPLGNTSDVYVRRVQTAMRPLSHHFVLYSIDQTMAPGWPCTPQPNVVRDIRNPDGSMNLLNMVPMACHVFIAGSMGLATDYTFPTGVALQLPASFSVDMNVHYVNRTSAEIPGEAYANLFTVPASQVTKVAHSLNMSNTAISLPAGKATTLEKTFLVSQTTTVIMLTSHMHQLGTRFQIKIVGGPRDGELVYESLDWEHPQQISFPTPIVLEKGQGLKSVITWNNTTTHTVTFGLQSTDEMGIIFGYYY